MKKKKKDHMRILWSKQYPCLYFRKKKSCPDCALFSYAWF